MKKTFKEVLFRCEKVVVKNLRKENRKRRDAIYKKILLLKATNNNMPQKFKFVRKCSTKLSSESKWTNESEMCQMEPNTIKWYFGGSKATERTEAGKYGRRIKFF